MIAIRSGLRAYRVATAELPTSARLGSDTEGAIVVIPGDRSWAKSARRAFDENAAAVVIADPDSVDGDECSRLQDSAGDRPVIIDRPLLRADLAECASRRSEFPSYLAVDLAAASPRRPGVTRDAMGWMRVLGGGHGEVHCVERTPSASLVFVQFGDGAVTGALTATTVTGVDRGSWIRAVAVAETRVEVVIDEADARASVEVATADGVLRLARRFESRERLSLRRAIEAVTGDGAAMDLTELRSDAAIADRVARAPSR